MTDPVDAKAALPPESLFSGWPLAPLFLFFGVMLMALASDMASPERSGENAKADDFTLTQPAASRETPGITLEYRKEPLEDLTRTDGLLAEEGWQALSLSRAAIGFHNGPATFRVTLTNQQAARLDQWITVQAPYLDHIRAARLESEGSNRLVPMAAMGGAHPFSARPLPIPFWNWPVSLAANETATFFFEVENAGPTMFPVSVQNQQALMGHSAKVAVFDGVLLGLSLFALCSSLFMACRFRTLMLVWLAVLTLSMVYIQVVLNGLGSWLFWPDMPSLNSLLNAAMAMTLIAYAQHANAALNPSPWPHTMLDAISIAAVLVLMVGLAGAPVPVQSLLLVLGAVVSGVILTLSLCRFRHSIYARYFTVAVVAVTGGFVFTALRTVGLVPVSPLTDSAFSLGAIMASVILLSAAAHFFWSEQRGRRIAAQQKAREQAQRVKIQADLDAQLRRHKVTGKPNRVALEARLGYADTTVSRYQIVIIRLNHFREIQRAIGYQEAEKFIPPVMEELEQFLSEAAGTAILRVEGSLVTSIDTMTVAFAIRGEKDSNDPFWSQLQSRLKQDFRSERYSFNWRASVGVASYPRHGNTVSEVLSAAGFASVEEKSVINFYDTNVQDHQQRQQLLMLDLDEALRCDQMTLYYQPKLALASESVESVEALIRWEHPEFGMIPPGDWIPMVEELGSITRVTTWVMARVAQDLGRIRQRFGEGCCVAINISSRDLRHDSFPDELLQAIEQYDASPRDFILEVTETGVINDPVNARAMLERLIDLGFEIALDDFGTGTSSLSALTTFPLHEVKIDRAFLTDILQDDGRRKVLSATVELARSIGLRTVVEGVEDREVALWLQQFSGIKGQGFLWGRPQPL